MTDRTWRYFVLLFVCIVIGALLLREPVLRPYQELGEKIAADQTRLRELRGDLTRRREGGPVAAQVAALYGPALDAPERRGRATLFYRQIEALLVNSGLEVVSLQPKSEVIADNGVVSFPVVVNAEGSLESLVGLLSQIRATTALVVVERLNIRRRDDPRAPVAVQATLTAYGLADRATRDALARAKAKTSKRS
ncbi:MAG: hypothetical protein HUU35_18200 [Armatimonadetes bacterium]|nr:hypothetical protein [Armatimonadota bacterium]